MKYLTFVPRSTIYYHRLNLKEGTVLFHIVENDISDLNIFFFRNLKQILFQKEQKKFDEWNGVIEDKEGAEF
jgi:hypothetical protein